MKSFIIAFSLFVSLTLLGKRMVPNANMVVSAEYCSQLSEFAKVSFRFYDLDSTILDGASLRMWNNDKTIVKHVTSDELKTTTIFVEPTVFNLSTAYDSIRMQQWIRTMSFHQDSCYMIDVYFTRFGIEIGPEEYLQLNVDKPVIYLYNKEAVNFSLELDIKGTKKFVYPTETNFNSDQKISWSGTVTNSGIRVNEKVYPYLFWEAKQKMIFAEETGFCIEGSKVVPFLEEKLTLIGLNDKERTDFITYWAPKMINNPFNLIHFYLDEDYERKIAELKINPKPETSIRVFMIFQIMGHNNQIPIQVLKSKKREGFTLVEWGGAEILTIKNE